MRSIAFALGLVLVIPGTLAAREAKLDPGKVHELKSAKHGRIYSLIVPSKYSKKRSWPLVISSHGRGGSGKGEMRPWQALANRHGFIVACPDMVTATHNRPPTSKLPGWKEDDEVVLSIIEFVKARFRVNRRAVMITGFSGGGNPSYHTGLGHPEVFTHICTRGGNFSPQQVPHDDDVLAAGRKHLRIFIFYGDKDHPLILGEDGRPGAAQAAYDALKAAKYEHVVIEKVTNMGHDSRPEKAATWFAEYVDKHAKQFKAGDKADGHLAKADALLEKDKVPQAIKEIRKALGIQEKAGLAPDAQRRLDALSKEAQAHISDATAAKDAGKLDDARKALANVARRYKGLPEAKEATALLKTWKD